MTFDPFKPQAYNVGIGHEPEGADATPCHPLEAPPIPYAIPAVVAIEPDADLYPRAPYGVWVLTTK